MNLIARRYIGPFWYRRKWLEATQWYDDNQLQALQLKLLQELIQHCHNTVPYYRAVFNERRIKPANIRTLDDIKQIPVLTKQDVLSAGAKIFSGKYPKCFYRIAYTGGTTGTPLKLRRSVWSIGDEHAFVRRQWDWAGVRLSDRCAYLTGRIITDPNETESRLWTYDPVMKELILSTYHLSENTAAKYAEVINRYNIKAIVGYPSAVYLLAKTCCELRIDLEVESVLTSSETLTESMKDMIERAFSCEVFDFYGSAERVCYIFTCERGNYHCIPEYGITEFIPIDPNEPNRCKLVATGFWNWAMPLIRYELGDVVNLSDDACTCGRSFRVIRSIEGREGDVVVTPSGSVLGAAILTHLLYGTNYILESQIVQDAIDHVTIKYIPTKEFTNRELQAFRALIHKHLPSELKVDIERVAAISRTSSGKLRPVVSAMVK